LDDDYKNYAGTTYEEVKHSFLIGLIITSHGIIPRVKDIIKIKTAPRVYLIDKIRGN